MGETNKDVWAGDGAGASGTGDRHEGAVDRMEKRAEGKSGMAWQGRRLFRRKEVGMRKTDCSGCSRKGSRTMPKITSVCRLWPKTGDDAGHLGCVLCAKRSREAVAMKVKPRLQVHSDCLYQSKNSRWRAVIRRLGDSEDVT